MGRRLPLVRAPRRRQGARHLALTLVRFAVGTPFIPTCSGFIAFPSSSLLSCRPCAPACTVAVRSASWGRLSKVEVEFLLSRGVQRRVRNAWPEDEFSRSGYALRVQNGVRTATRLGSQTSVFGETATCTIGKPKSLPSVASLLTLAFERPPPPRVLPRGAARAGGAEHRQPLRAAPGCLARRGAPPPPFLLVRALLCTQSPY